MRAVRCALTRSRPHRAPVETGCVRQRLPGLVQPLLVLALPGASRPRAETGRARAEFISL